MILSGQKSVGDKLREMKLAIELEKKFTKDQILEGYLNIVFFNRDAYGIEAAARYFFSTTAKDLNLPQAALLAGLVNSPSFYDPVGPTRRTPSSGATRSWPRCWARARSSRRNMMPPSPPASSSRSPGAAGLRRSGHGPVLLRLHFPPHPQQPRLRRQTWPSAGASCTAAG